MKLFSRFFLLSIFLPALLPAQNLSLGSWRVNLPYSTGQTVTDAGDKIYCVADNGLFSYDKKGGEVTRLSKVDGLSDNDINLVSYDKVHHVLVICYRNGNIDLWYDQDRTLVNRPDIKNANITGNNKNINAVLFLDKYAYLSCGFGIVLLDLVKKEIKDTYHLGVAGTNPAVFDLDVDDQSNLYAATDSGVYIASLNNPNLVDYASWTKIFSGTGTFNHIVFFGNKLLVNNHTPVTNGLDTILEYQNGIWSVNSVVLEVRKFSKCYGTLLITYIYNIKQFDQNYQVIKVIDQLYPYMFTNDALMDENNIYWVAEGTKGLMRYDGTNAPDFIKPNGPKSALVSDFSVTGEVLWVAHGPVPDYGILQNQYRPGIISSFVAGTWQSLSRENTDNTVCNMDSIFDLTSIVVDPADADHVYAGSYDRGVMEFNDGNLVYLYNKTTTNGVLQYIPTTDYIRVGGLVLDQQNNLWVSTAQVANMLNVKKPDGSWQGFTFPGVLKTTDYLGHMVVDDYNQVWCINVNVNDLGGIFIFNNNNTLEDLSDDHYRLLLDKAGAGGLPSKDVRAIARDLDGSIWVGTGTGVAVFYSPGAVFSGSGFDAQQVLIQYQGYNQYLLETEVVTAIAVDGANRKWFGTQNGGVFLMSADGTKQIENFNTSNSPILSDNILRIDINKATGEVFFGTDKGIISYQGTATEGTEGCSDTYVYPNPVTENYDGPIAIKGLAANSNVKITDISGSVIYETTAQGGQAIWDGRSLNGEKAHTGVYLVFCSDETGKNTCVTKMVFIN
jgi:ligand-binding sensor domain-containing protein